jgi:outer membrane protein assembly factor BamA
VAFFLTIHRPIFLLIFFLFNSAACFLNASVDEVPFSSDMPADEIGTRLAGVGVTPLLLEELSFISDCGISDYELRYLTDLKHGAHIGVPEIQKAISNLFKKNKFEKITVSLLPGVVGKKVVMNLTSFWTMYKCTVSGFMRGKGIYRRLYRMRQGDLFDEEKHRHSVASIKKSLVDDGYFDHTLTEQCVRDAQTKEVSVNLKLKLGDRYYIDSVEFIAQSDRRADKEIIALQDKIYKMSVASVKHQYFSQGKIEQLQTEAIQLLGAEGFFETTVTVVKKVNGSKKTVGLLCTLDFGRHKQMCAVGNKFFSRAQLFERLMPFGKSMSLFPAVIFIEEFEDLYRVHGFSSVAIRAVEDAERITFVIDEGPRVDIKTVPAKEQKSIDESLPAIKSLPMNFGKTIMRGHLNIPFEYIERSLHYSAGQPWDKEKLRKTYSSLRTLDMFENLYVHPDNPAYIEDEKAVLINVEPAPLYELLLRGGAGLQRGGQECWFGRGVTYTLGGSFVMRNVTNHADSILLNADIARGGQTFTGSYTVPWLWRSPTRTTLKGYVSNIDHPAFVLNGVSLYRAKKEGVLLSFQRHFDGLDCHFNTGLEWLTLGVNCHDTPFENCIDCVACAYDIDPCMIGPQLPYFFVEPTVVLTYEQDSASAAPAPLTFLSAKIMLPAQGKISDTYYVRLLAEQTLFYPIGPVIGALRGRLGYIMTPCFARVNPLDRFYCGGPNSIRSYEFDMCPPYGVFNDIVDNCCRTVPQGGKAVATISAEMRFPLYGALGGVVFQDVGTLVGCSPWSCENNLLLATGFGLRYQTPIGPLSFDLGWKKARRPSESCYAWFLGLGSNF